MNAQDQFNSWTEKWEKAQREGVFDDARKPAQPAPQHTPDYFGNYPTLDIRKGLDAVDAEYWRQVYQMSSSAGDAPDVTDNSALEDGGDHPIHDHTQRKGKNIREFFGGDDRPRGKPYSHDGERASPKAKSPGVGEVYEPPSTEISDKKGEMEEKVRMMGTDPNPQFSATFGPDTIDRNTGHVRVSPGLAAADKNITKLDGLKRSLYELECKMSDIQGLSESKVKSLDSKLKSLKKQLDDISDDLVPRYPADHL